MNRFARAAAVSLALLAAAAAGAAPPARGAFRIEVHPVSTVTLTTAQALAGGTEGAPATIAGELRLPFGAGPKFPAVLMLHGDAGAIANQTLWIDALNDAGIAVFTLDSYSGRGAVSPDAGVISMPPSVGALARVVDAERALAVLAKHPRIDPARIAVMGFSSGARTAITAAQTRFASVHGSPDLRFAAFIAFYPPCNVRLIDDTALQSAPLRIFHGEADRITSAAACRDYVARLRAAGADAAIVTFPGAHHGFDNVSNPELMRMPEAPTPVNCMLEERVRGELVNTATGKPLAMGDACIEKGMVAGYDAAADTAARAAVRAFLVERFGLRR